MEIEYTKEIIDMDELLLLEINGRVNKVVGLLENEMGISGVLIEMLKIDKESLDNFSSPLAINLKNKIDHMLANLEDVF